MSGTPFHGPLSPVGAGIGVLLAVMPYALGVRELSTVVAVWCAVPLVGVLLLVPSRTRQLGTGLVASALTVPLTVAALLAVTTGF